MPQNSNPPLLTLQQALSARTYLDTSLSQMEEDEAVLQVRLRQTQRAMKQAREAVERLDREVIPALKHKHHEARKRRPGGEVEVLVVE